jgi:putative phosphoribosyl transferase
MALAPIDLRHLSRDSVDPLISVALGPAVALRALIAVPPDASCLVVVPHIASLAHRLPYNRSATGLLNRRGIATVLLECLTIEEQGGAAPPVGARALCDRLLDATDRLTSTPDIEGLAVGYLTTTIPDAAVALRASGRRRSPVGAVVCVGVPGRAELAGAARLRVPALLIGSGSIEDYEHVVHARRVLGKSLHFQVMPGAEVLGSGNPGPHKRAFLCAADWFDAHLAGR